MGVPDRQDAASAQAAGEPVPGTDKPASEPGAPGPDEDGITAEADPVTAFWRDLGLPGLVDVHTHFMPPNVLAKVWAFFDSGRAAVGQEWPIVYRWPEAERVALLRAFGVRRFGALLYPHKPGMAAWLNAWASGFAARTPDALHSATFFPEPGAGAYVAEAVGAGARLFKAHLQVGGYDPRDPLLDPVKETTRPYTRYLPAAVQEFLAQNPKVHFHFTPTYSSWLNQVELVRQNPARCHRPRHERRRGGVDTAGP